MCPATTPQLVATMLEARRELGKAVADELTAVAMGLVGGMIIKAVLSRIVGVRRGGKVPPNNAIKRAKIRAKNDQVNIGGGLEKGSEKLYQPEPCKSEQWWCDKRHPEPRTSLF
jgi:hypothetical protein